MFLSCFLHFTSKTDLLTFPKLKFALRYTWIRLSKCPFNSFSLHFFLSKANCWHPFLKHLRVFCYQTSNYYRCSLYDKPSSRVKTMYPQWGQILYKVSLLFLWNMYVFLWGGIIMPAIEKLEEQLLFPGREKMFFPTVFFCKVFHLMHISFAQHEHTIFLNLVSICCSLLSFSICQAVFLLAL